MKGGIMRSVYNIKEIKNISGQSALEFALIIPLILILVLAAAQAGFMVYSRMQMQQASREAARIISTTNNNYLALRTVKTICGSDARVVIEPGEEARRLGDMVTVRVSRRPAGFLQIMDWISGREIVLNSEAIMRMECGQDDI
jgi:hypothetical protein